MIASVKSRSFKAVSGRQSNQGIVQSASESLEGSPSRRLESRFLKAMKDKGITEKDISEFISSLGEPKKDDGK